MSIDNSDLRVSAFEMFLISVRKLSSLPENHVGVKMCEFGILKRLDGLDRTFSRVVCLSDYCCVRIELAYHRTLPHLEVWPIGASRILEKIQYLVPQVKCSIKSVPSLCNSKSKYSLTNPSFDVPRF